MGVRCLGIRRCFEFVISERLGSGQQQQNEDPATVLRQWLNEELSESPTDKGESGPGTTSAGADAASATSNVPPSGSSKAHEDSVFMQSYIPRSLNEVYDPERDVDAVLRGEGKQLIYADSIGLVDTSSSAPAAVSSSDSRPDGEKKTSRVRFGSDVPGGSDESDESSEGEGGDGEDEEGEEDSGSEDGDETKPFEERRPRGHRHEDREEKKVRNLIYLLHIPYSQASKLTDVRPLSCIHFTFTGEKESRQSGEEREAETQDAQSGEEEENEERSVMSERVEHPRSPILIHRFGSEVTELSSPTYTFLVSHHASGPVRLVCQPRLTVA